jgi:hypothetical protein
MPSIGQIEKRTQDRVAALFRDRLDYDHLGNRIARPATPTSSRNCSAAGDSRQNP